MYRKVLAPLDGSALAENTLEHLKVLIKGCNIPEVIILRVIEPLSAQVLGSLSRTSSPILAKLETNNRQEAISYVRSIADRLKKENINAQPVTLEGNAADEILDYANKNNIDLIIMSSHGRSGIKRWFFGSVTQNVINHSTVPVLTIIPKGYHSK
jgi:nucleotide-binding universal stress UspA family protein